MSNLIFPYPRLNEPRFNVECDLVVADLVNREIDLSQFLDKQDPVAGLKVEVQLARDGLGDIQHMVVGVTLTCGRTDLRQTTMLERSPLDTSIWLGNLELDGRNVRGPAKLTPLIAGGPDEFNLRTLATSAPWTVYVDDVRDNLPRGGMNVVWRKFSEHDFLKDFRNDPFYLEFSLGSSPVVLLNEDMEELRRSLPRRGRPPGLLAALYETTRTSIARSVWQSLCQASVSAIQVNEDDPEDVQLPAEEWQRQVLRKVLPKALGMAEDEAIRFAADSRVSPDRAQEIASKVSLMIGHEIAEEGKAIRAASKILENSHAS